MRAWRGPRWVRVLMGVWLSLVLSDAGLIHACQPREAEGGAHRFHEARLGKARCADQQRVAAGQNRCQRQLDHSLLAKDGPADFGLYAGQRFGCRVGVRHRGFRT